MSVRSLRYNTIEQHFTKSALASTDRDALAFLEAAQIYNANQQRAIVNLVRSLKRVGLWSKMKAIYPFVGGTASAHKWNLKDPRDANAAFRLTFYGGWTHSSTGADPNGTSGYADTYFVANGSLDLYNGHLSYYSRDSGGSVNSTVPIGVASNTETWNGKEIWAIRFRDTTFAGMQHSQTAFPSASDYAVSNQTSVQGYWLQSRRTSDATTLKLFKNGASIANATTNPTGQALNQFSVYIGALRNMTIGAPYADGYTNAQCAFATIGDGLTDSDATNLYNIVDLYQKRLGRAV